MKAFLIWTRQNNVHIFGICGLQRSLSMGRVEIRPSSRSSSFSNVLKHDKSETLSPISKFDLDEGGSISTRSTDGDIQLSLSSVSCFISACLSVALLKATYSENVHILLSCLY